MEHSGRYQRHSLIDWFDQDELKASSVLVVGAGATGNEVIKNLALLGLGSMHIVDPDRIEIHNLTRSVLFSEKHIGRYKAGVAADAAKAIDPSIHVSHCVGDFWKCISIAQLREYDAVFCCVDNFEARIRLNKLSLIAGTTLYNLGIDSRGVSVERYPFSSEQGCACYECNLPPSVYARIRERYSCGWLRKRAFEERKVPTTTITASMAGAVASSMFLQERHADAQPGALRWFFDSVRLTASVSALEKREGCPACSTRQYPQVHLTTSGLVRQLLPDDVAMDGEVTVWLSDKLVLSAECKLCGRRQEILGLAEEHDDSLTFCRDCSSASNDVAITDCLTIGELQSLFLNRRLPVKFVSLFVGDTHVILEMEDSHERNQDNPEDSGSVQEGGNHSPPREHDRGDP
jgi:molybdopterin/thiamine biosynthesis adenylyltransferase